MKTRAQKSFQLQSPTSARDKRALKRNDIRDKLFAPIRVIKEHVPTIKKEDFLKGYQNPKLFTVGSLVFAKQKGSRLRLLLLKHFQDIRCFTSALKIMEWFQLVDCTNIVRKLMQSLASCLITQNPNI